MKFVNVTLVAVLITWRRKSASQPGKNMVHVKMVGFDKGTISSMRRCIEDFSQVLVWDITVECVNGHATEPKFEISIPKGVDVSEVMPLNIFLQKIAHKARGLKKRELCFKLVNEFPVSNVAAEMIVKI